MNGAAVKAYSLAKDGSKYLSANFRVREFASKDGADTLFVSDGLVQVLQQIRSHFGKPVTINSAYRTEAHNESPGVGGASYSQHLYGMAADIVVQGVSPSVAYAYADKLLGNSGGVGKYSWGIHVDVRKTKWRDPDAG